MEQRGPAGLMATRPGPGRPRRDSLPEFGHGFLQNCRLPRLGLGASKGSSQVVLRFKHVPKPFTYKMGRRGSGSLWTELKFGTGGGCHRIAPGNPIPSQRIRVLLL